MIAIWLGTVWKPVSESVEGAETAITAEGSITRTTYPTTHGGGTEEWEDAPVPPVKPPPPVVPPVVPPAVRPPEITLAIEATIAVTRETVVVGESITVEIAVSLITFANGKPTDRKPAPRAYVELWDTHWDPDVKKAVEVLIASISTDSEGVGRITIAFSDEGIHTLKGKCEYWAAGKVLRTITPAVSVHVASSIWTWDDIRRAREEWERERAAAMWAMFIATLIGLCIGLYRMLKK